MLRGLVHGGADTPTHAQIVRILCAYRFQSVVNEMAFELVRTHRTISATLLREHLPALLTNQGFPDEDWEPLLQPTDWSSAQLLRAAHLLIAQRPV